MKIACAALLITTLSLLASAARADDPATPATKTGEHGHPLVRLILAHEQELKLSADQITKLKAIEDTPGHPHPHLEGHKASAATAGAAGGEAKSPAQTPPHHELPPRIKAILTADQQAEVLKLMEEHHHGHANHGKHAGNGTTAK